MPESELRALIAGVLAAPVPVDIEAWMQMVPGGGAAPARAELRNIYDRMSARNALRREKASSAGESANLAMRRIAALRIELSRRGLDGFIVPLADEHHGEFIARRARRLAWLTGFTGSAGIAIVLGDRAAIFVDGRYTLQVRDQVDSALYAPHDLVAAAPAEWVAANLGAERRLGYDSWLHTADAVAHLRAACEQAGGMLLACETNPIDAVWEDQPPPPLAPVVPHDLRYAGKESAEKRRELAEKLRDGNRGGGVDAAVLTDPASIAWLLNIRGGDVPNTPLALGFALLHDDARVDLFIDSRKLVPGLAAHLGDEVACHPPEAFGPALDALAAAGSRVQVDPATAAAWIADRIAQSGAKPVTGSDPCALPKACKNPVELDGARAAHLRDGAALCRFLAWFAGEAPKGGLTERDAADRLEVFRREDALFRGLSFATISGAGSNGAIVHYRVTERTNRRIEPGMVYLIDSGAQYPDGTTDVTRTLAVGDPPDAARDHFTRVLKGHIALALARFPAGTTGTQIDILARGALWEAGLDFDHGTGHGVGSYLGVHEGPQRIAKSPSSVALRPGMIVSNEPGYYKAGAYGIRIENLVVVVPAPGMDGAERDMLGFETLTHAPIDRAMIQSASMTDIEIAWLDSYHALVFEKIAPRVDPATADWLAAATRPILGD